MCRFKCGNVFVNFRYKVKMTEKITGAVMKKKRKKRKEKEYV